MSDDITEITCDGCTGASDWYCVKCWDGLVRELHDAEVQRDAAKWREKLAVSQLEEVRATVERFREAQKATAEGWRHEVAEIAGLVGAPSHTHELAHFVQNVVNDRDAARERDRLGKMVASRIQAERDAARQRVAELEQLLALRTRS